MPLQPQLGPGMHLLFTLREETWGAPSPQQTTPKRLNNPKTSCRHSPDPPEARLGSPGGRGQPRRDRTREVVSCRIPFPSRSVPGKGRIEAQPEGGGCRPHPLDSARLHRGENPPPSRRQLQGCPRNPVGSLGFIQRERPGAAFPSELLLRARDTPSSDGVVVTSPVNPPAGSFPGRCRVQPSRIAGGGKRRIRLRLCCSHTKDPSSPCSS